MLSQSAVKQGYIEDPFIVINTSFLALGSNFRVSSLDQHWNIHDLSPLMRSLDDGQNPVIRLKLWIATKARETATRRSIKGAERHAMFTNEYCRIGLRDIDNGSKFRADRWNC